MHGSIRDDNVTVYFGINRNTLEVESVTAAPDGELSGSDEGAKTYRMAPGSDEQTEVILAFDLIELFWTSKSHLGDARTQRRLQELTDLSAGLKSMAAAKPEIEKAEREVDVLAPLPQERARSTRRRSGLR